MLLTSVSVLAMAVLCEGNKMKFNPAAASVMSASSLTVRLPCSVRLVQRTSKITQMSWQRVGQAKPLTINRTKQTNDSRISLVQSSDKNQWDLIITDLKLEDAGDYLCQIKKGSRIGSLKLDKQQGVKLIVKDLVKRAAGYSYGTCDFEDDRKPWCKWYATSYKKYSGWSVHKASDPAVHGPAWDHSAMSKDGHFAYVDNTEGKKLANLYLFSTPKSGNFCLSFWVFLSDASHVTLEVYYRVFAGGSGKTLLTLYPTSGSNLVTNSWFQVQVPFDVTGNQGTREILIKGSLFPGNVSSIAVDDFKFIASKCPQPGNAWLCQLKTENNS